MFLRLFSTLSLLFLFLNAPAKDKFDQSINGKVEAVFAEWNKTNSPGCAVAVVKDGVVVYKGGFGMANLEYDIPITSATIFHVASVSKQFTAMAVAMLADEGKLSLDDDIRKHLPELHEFSKTIKIRHLIHHTSGLRDQWELLRLAGWRMDDVITQKDILNFIRKQKDLNFEPGEQEIYCNTGYTLLSEIVAKVSGDSFEKWTEQNIFIPLGMTNTHFHNDHERIVKNRAYSYRTSSSAPQGFKIQALNYANVGATSLFTTVEDLAKWSLNFENPKVGNTKVISQMKERFKLNSGEEITYAFGLVHGKQNGFNTLGHSGADAGFRSNFLMVPEQRLTVIVLANHASMRPLELCEKTANIFLPEASMEKLPEVATKEVKPLDSTVIGRYIGRYLLHVNDGTDFRVDVRSNKLVQVRSSGNETELLPISETEFKMVNSNSRFTFQTDSKGEVTGFKYIGGNGENFARKIPLEVAQPLDQFAGTYYSDELELRIVIEMKDGKMRAQHRRHGDLSMRLVTTDLFSVDQLGRMQFLRDSTNNIKGFSISNGRIHNLAFEKVALQ